MHILRLQLLTNDIAATERFYREVPGLKVLDRSDEEITFEAGSTRLVFRHSAIPHPVYHFAFTIPANKLQEALAQMAGKTSILSLPDGNPIADFAHWSAGAFYFYDNNGNILEYIVRRGLDNAEEIPFDASRICCISEAGLVTDNVPALAAGITGQYDLPLFSKQPPQDNFTVMGDDHGLLILVARGRHWFPTTIEAAGFPLALTLRNDKGQLHELSLGQD
ncbi:VOC family protein [Taibaiella koreensis]|uniref:VOC family protein n=1 Tax=Taibaiella koreensis TaxID=1268548 RepID=UPI000E5A040C|nr:VOC family protein [Taibaiella koreensis]